MGQAAKKKSEKATGRLNTIGNFYPDLVSLEVMRAFIAKEKIKIEGIDDDATAEQVALGLTLHFREHTAEDDMCQCETCHGEAPVSFDACPYCGLEGEADDEPAEVVGGAATVAIVPPLAPESDPAPKTTKAKKEPKTKPAKAKEETTMAGAAEVIDSGKQNLVKVNGRGGALATEKDLDVAVERALKFKIDSAKAYYQQAQVILDINTRGLWKLRKDDDGKVRYSGFDAFCHHELNMSPTNAFNMMEVARKWKVEDVEKLGRSKAVMILKAAPEDRKALAEAAANGASYREVQKGVEKSKKERGYTGESDAAKRGSKGAKARAEKIKSATPAKEKDAAPAADKITVAKIEGLKTIKLYAKPASLKNLNLDECKRAKRIGDQPFGRLELANGVVMYISVIEGKDGFLQAKVDTRRESPVG